MSDQKDFVKKEVSVPTRYFGLFAVWVIYLALAPLFVSSDFMLYLISTLIVLPFVQGALIFVDVSTGYELHFFLFAFLSVLLVCVTSMAILSIFPTGF